MLYTATTFVCALIVVAMQMPAKQIVNAGPAPVGPYSPAVKAGSLIYLSGTLAQDAAGAIVGKGDIAAQTRRVIERMHEILTLSGSSLEQVVAVTVYLRNAGDFAAMNDAYKAHWPLNPPTRTTVIANLVRPDALVEMSMIAVPLGAERTVIHPAGWMRSPNPYSYAIRSGETLFLSGLVSRNGRDNSVVTGDITKQTRVVMDNAGELQPEWLQDKARVGLTAGASAPEVLVQEVIAKIKSMGAVAVRKMDGIQETVKFPLPKGLKL